MAKFCANCGSPLDGAGKFCPSCGAQVMDAPQAQEKPEEKPQQASQEMNNPPAPRAAQGQPQSAMRQNVPGQNPGQQPYGGFPGQGGPNAAYGMGMMGAQAFNGERYVPDEGIKEMFFRYDNRLNRKRYIMRALALVLAYFVFTLILAVIGESIKSKMIPELILLLSIVFVIPSVMLMLRRLHDVDRPTWWIIGAFIPYVNVAFSLFLLFAKGTTGPNQYGPDPLEG